MSYTPPPLSEDVEDKPSTIICDKAIIIADLISYGENEIAKNVISQNENDYSRYYKRLASIANWFLHNVPSGRKDSRTITFSKAFTLAAIFLCEGVYREPIKNKRNLIHYCKVANIQDDETIIRYIDEIS